METVKKQKIGYQLCLFLFQQQCWPQKIREIIENHSEFSVWANSCNKLFKLEVDLDKPWNYLWYCYQKAPPPLPPFWKVRGEVPPPSCLPEKFMVCHFTTKCAAVKFAKPWMSTTSRNREIPPTLVRPCVQHVPGNWRGTSCWLNPRKSGQEVAQEPGGVIISPTLLAPVLVWSRTI